MLRNGAETIVPMWRNDRGNTGLADSVRAAATASGATVSPGVVYEPDTTDFTTSLNDVSGQLQSLIAKAGADKVAVYLAGFEEVADVLSTARTVSGIDGVRWYGGDGSAQTKALLASGPATFVTMAKVKGYPSPLVALPADQAKKDADLLGQISKRAKGTADAFTLAAYDALNVAARTLADAPADADTETLRAAFAAQADGAKGATGTIKLDAAGDRVSTPYVFWSVCQRPDGDPRWRDTGRWTPASDPTAPGRVRPKSCPEG
jgi:branched-chain amino acid transport system substrate-binding protein